MTRSLRRRAWLATTLLLGLATVAVAQTTRVLVVGDSWAELLWDARALRDAFAAHGHPEILEKGDVTALSGTEAREWANDPAMLQLIADELAANPTIDIVQITLGGNDFLAGEPGGGWYLGMPDPGALFVSIATDVATVIDYALDLDPELRVVLSAYDYPNFVDFSLLFCLLYCCEQYQGMGEPSTPELNAAIVQMVSQLEALESGRPRLEVVGHWGLMQYLYGFPDAEPPIPPGTLLPPGDPDLPSPIEAMLGGGDCIHLSATNYDAVGEDLWWSYYEFALYGVFRDGFESGDTGAWGP